MKGLNRCPWNNDHAEKMRQCDCINTRDYEVNLWLFQVFNLIRNFKLVGLWVLKVCLADDEPVLKKEILKR